MTIAPPPPRRTRGDFADVIAVKDAFSARALGTNPFAALGVDAVFAASSPPLSPFPGLHAVGVGHKLVHGKPTDDLCIRLYVDAKRPVADLPTGARLPDRIDGVPTDIIEAARAVVQTPAAATPVPPLKPLVAGVSAAHRAVTAGTLGYFCRSTRPGDPPDAVYLLSNNHVLADVNVGLPNDDILHPGRLDGGVAPADRVAGLSRYINLVFGGSAPNRVDAAAARLDPAIPFTATIRSIGPVSGTTAPAELLKIRKHGRTTGYRSGIVTDVSVDPLVTYDRSGGLPPVPIKFIGQIRIEPDPEFPDIARRGDSGSLVVTHDDPARAVGLFFACPDHGRYGLVNPINEVLNLLELQLV